MRSTWIALLTLAACKSDPERRAPATEPTPAPTPAPATAPAPAPVAVAPPPDAAVVFDATAAVAKQRPDAREMSEDEAGRYVAMLTAEGNESESPDRSPGSDLGEQVKIGGSHGRGTRTGDPRVGTGSGPGTDSGSATEAAPKSRIKTTSVKALDETSLTADAVKSKIGKVYMAGLLKCYKTALKRDATITGKLQVELTVDERGRGGDVSVTAPEQELATCIEHLAGNWTFPQPKDEDDEAAEAAFQLRFELAVDPPSP